MKGRINLVAAAFTLTALTYGLGRFAYGLLLPHIREDLSLSATGAGWIGRYGIRQYLSPSNTLEGTRPVGATVGD